MGTNTVLVNGGTGERGFARMSPAVATPKYLAPPILRVGLTAMQRFSGVFVLAIVGCDGHPPVSTAGGLSLERQGTQSLVSVADAGEPIGVAASGTVVAKMIVGVDTGYRLVDSAGSVVAMAAASEVGGWLAGDDGLFYTLAPAAAGITTVKPDGSAGPSYPLGEPGILRGVVPDSVDLVRPGPGGVAVVRVALDGSGQRIMLAEGVPEVAELLGVSAAGLRASGPREVLPSITTSADRVVVGNGHSYRILLYSAAGQPLGRIARDLPTMRLSERQIDNEIRQIEASGQKLEANYLKTVRMQLARQELPFFSPTQGLRFDGVGRLWVVGFEGDSAFADVFADTTFVRRFPIPCDGFDGQWDVAGQWLALSCGHRDAAQPGAELQLYRILGR